MAVHTRERARGRGLVSRNLSLREVRVVETASAVIKLRSRANVKAFLRTLRSRGIESVGSFMP